MSNNLLGNIDSFISNTLGDGMPFFMRKELERLDNTCEADWSEPMLDDAYMQLAITVVRSMMYNRHQQVFICSKTNTLRDMVNFCIKKIMSAVLDLCEKINGDSESIRELNQQMLKQVKWGADGDVFFGWRCITAFIIFDKSSGIELSNREVIAAQSISSLMTMASIETKPNGQHQIYIFRNGKDKA